MARYVDIASGYAPAEDISPEIAAFEKLFAKAKTYEELEVLCDLHCIPCLVSRDVFEEMRNPRYFYWQDLRDMHEEKEEKA